VADSGIGNTFANLAPTFPVGLSASGLYGSANVQLGSSAETNVPLGVITSYSFSTITSWEYND